MMPNITRRALIGVPIITSACGGSPTSTIQAAPTPPISVDDTNGLQAALDSQGYLELPDHRVYTSRSIIATKPVRIWGKGSRVSVIVSSADEALVLAPEAAISQGWRTQLSDFGIEPAVPGAGKSALVVRVKTGSFFSRSKFVDLYLGDFGGPGLLLDNSVANDNGIFSTMIRDCWIANGVKGILIGDSLTFDGNTIPDGPSRRATKSGASVGFDITTVNGSRLVVLRDNSVSTSGGGFRANRVDGLRLENNWFEYQSFYGIPFNGSQQGWITVQNGIGLVFRGNVVNPQSSGVKYALALDGMLFSDLGGANEFSGTGTDGDIAFLGTSHENQITGGNNYQGSRKGRVIGADIGLAAS
jgi:hypothetical protein